MRRSEPIRAKRGPSTHLGRWGCSAVCALARCKSAVSFLKLHSEQSHHNELFLFHFCGLFCVVVLLLMLNIYILVVASARALLLLNSGIVIYTYLFIVRDFLQEDAKSRASCFVKCIVVCSQVRRLLYMGCKKK